MTLTFKTKKHLEMGLPIGAVSPIDIRGHVCVIRDGKVRVFKEVQSNGYV